MRSSKAPRQLHCMTTDELVEQKTLIEQLIGQRQKNFNGVNSVILSRADIVFSVVDGFIKVTKQRDDETELLHSIDDVVRMIDRYDTGDGCLIVVEYKN